MAKASQVIKTQTNYNFSISIKPKSSDSSSTNSQSSTANGMVTCHVCDGAGVVPAMWYAGKKKK